jgi:hypothetical protein
MRLGRDIAAFVTAAVAVAAYAATHEGWGVIPLIGDSHRWATGAIALLALAMLALEVAVDRSVPETLLAVLGGAAVVMAGIAFWTASLTPLSILVAVVVVLFAAGAFEDVLHMPRRPIAT